MQNVQNVQNVQNESNGVSLNITPCPDEMNFDEAIIAHRDIKDGYEFGVPSILLKSAKFKKFIEELDEKYNFEIFDYSKSKNSIYKKYLSEDVRLYANGNSREQWVGFYCKTESNLLSVWNIYKKYIDKASNIQAYTHSFSIVNGKLEENISELKYEDLDYITPDYYPYIDTKLMLDQFFTGAENILLLTGEPGLGKSKLSTLAIKHAFENPNILPYDKLKINEGLDDPFITVSFVKSPDVLADDSFWRKLEQLSPDFCIIDDLDYMLTKRDSEIHGREDAIRNAFLNQFLSFTDGVEKHNTKFIITTNQSFDDVDSALLRKGRLFDILELRKLDKEEALKIWLSEELPSEMFFETFESHEVLQAELGSMINKLKNDRINNSSDPYLKEAGISKIDKASRVKNIRI